MNTEDSPSSPTLLPSRRSFLYGTLWAPVGLQVLRSELTRAEVTPPAVTVPPTIVPGKEDLHVLSDRPLSAETPMHLLDDQVTPSHRMFVRNNGLIPLLATNQDPTGWQLTIDGEVERPLLLSLHDLQTRFQHISYQLVLECAGNGRAGYTPAAKGNQWTYGGIGCPLWEGVRLKDVLEHAGVKSSAVYLGYYSHDIHPSGDLDKIVISRGFPIAKALDEMTLIAWGMNGKPLLPEHGFPARLVCPGFPASASGKWLKRLWIRDKIHDGAKMTGHSYRMPRFPVAPGTEVPESEMDIIQEMPVKSLITFPQSKTTVAANRKVTTRGFAWSGAGDVGAVHVSHNFGQSWQETELAKPRNRFAWQRWEAQIELPKPGYYELWARATDSRGVMQPMVVPGWNPEGYINNAMPRIALYAQPYSAALHR